MVSRLNKAAPICWFLINCQIEEKRLPKMNLVRLEELVTDKRMASKPPKPFLASWLILLEPLAARASKRSWVRASRSSRLADPIHWLISWLYRPGTQDWAACGSRNGCL